ncbi:trimeric intracellular cation channel family protein [Microbispora sp. NBC_01189]|uniref:trimeric intracellular cation channel family protein n=1 Tax=Microbispora sp. NBC_01189 TaxID=2903583 RepID=UPI002E168258|nr:trimeric intracellular cation channel family protein [Microbispora sp. NBC_01189]
MEDSTAVTPALDLAGIFVFALSGALQGVRKRLDVVGMAVLAFFTAVGGGITRDLFIGVQPAAFRDTWYLLVPIAATAIAFFWHPQVERAMPGVLVFDAAGLGLFCAVGTAKALAYGLSPLHAVLLGVCTAVGGGVLRDVLSGEMPTLLYDRQLYAVPAMLGSTAMATLYAMDIRGFAATLSSAVLAFALRILAMRYGWRAPLARGVGGPA